MTLLLAVVGIVFFWRTRSVLKSIERDIRDLTARVSVLEGRAASTPQRPAVADAVPSHAAPAEPVSLPESVAARGRVVAKAPGVSAERPERPEPVVAPVPVVAAEPVTVGDTPTLVQPATPAAAPAESLESRIGSRWLLYVGVLAIIVGAAYFEKLAIDNHWLSETMRVVQGTVVGLLLAVGAHYIVRRGYDTYGQILSGCGMAVMFVAAYAAFNFYHLVSYGPAFAWMAGITVVTALLSDRYRSLGLAMVAVGGGFATPFLLPAGGTSEIPLFTYDALLIAGTLFLVARRDWPMLGVVSFVATLLTVDSWMTLLYKPERYLTAELFLTLFTGMFLAMIRQLQRSTVSSAAFARLILWLVVPVYYFGSLAILWPQGNAFLIYLLAISFLGVAITRNTAPRWRLLFWCAATLPLLPWTAMHLGSAWFAAGISTWLGLFALHLAGLLEAIMTRERKIDWPELSVIHLNGLVPFFGLYLLLDAHRAVWSAPAAVALALLHAGVAWWTTQKRRDVGLHFAAVAFSLIALAIAIEFDGAAAITGWAAEAAVVMWLGLREQRRWMRIAGLVLLALSVVSLIDLQLQAPTVGQLPLLNPRAGVGLFVVALLYALARIHDRQTDEHHRALRTGLALVAAKLLLLAVAASELAAFWALRQAAPFEPDAQIIVATFIDAILIVWLGLRRRQDWMHTVGFGLMGVATFWLLMLQAAPALNSYVPLLNGRVAAGLTAITACYVALQLIHRLDVPFSSSRRYVAALSTAASVLTISLVTSEVVAFWSSDRVMQSWPATRRTLAREMTLTLAWSLYATAAIIVGLRRNFAPIRYFAISLFGLTILKVVFIDLAYLSQIYRVLSIVGLGVLLLITSYLYQRRSRE